MSEADSRKTAQQLFDELKKAGDEFRDQQRALDELVLEAPSGLPFSDGQRRIVQSGQRLKFAFEKYEEAVQRYRSFVVDGVVPDEDTPDHD